jgi:hypothetical protein
MSRFASIEALADEVLATVIKEAQVKTASAKPKATKLVVPTARELRKLAEDLRAAPEEEEISPEELAAFSEDPEVMELLQLIESNPELLAQLMQEEGMDAPDMPPEMAGGIPGEPPGPPPGPPPGMPPGAPPGGDFPPVVEEEEEDDEEAGGTPPKKAKETKEASTSADLRKLAATLRQQSARTPQKRIKAAAMLHAATGIQHLVGGRK